MLTLTLNKMPVLIAEPVFKTIRAVLPLLNDLSRPDGTDAQRYHALERIVALLIPKPIRLEQLTADEISAFLAAIPQLCGLQSGESPDNTSGEETGQDQWAMIYGHLAACFGWDYDTIDNAMTFSRLKEMNLYLEKNPPTHQLVAGYLDYKPKGAMQSVSSFMRGLMAGLPTAKGIK